MVVIKGHRFSLVKDRTPLYLKVQHQRAKEYLGDDKKVMPEGGRMSQARNLFSLFFLLATLLTPAYAQKGLEEATVKVYTVHAEYDYDMPWQLAGQERGGGSGCIIRGNRILTNAHVVANQTFIQVKRAGEAKKYNATVEIVAHDCDLALLRVDDPNFFAGVKPMEIGTLPRMRDKVAVYGFPMGGEELSITEGVVSRIEVIRYSHSGVSLLSCQIDAAINPGNSGGPVIKDGKIVGIAFQGYMFAQNIGYMVPVPVIEHFLKDCEDGKYDGFPSIGIAYQEMDNPCLRSYFQMKEGESGVLVRHVGPMAAAKGILEVGDVILAIEGKTIANDGSINFRGTERIHFSHEIRSRFVGETIRCRILRGGIKMDVSIPLNGGDDPVRLVPYTQYDKPPSYYIVGGLVFQPLTMNYLRVWGDMDRVPPHLATHYYHGRQTDTRREVVVLTKVLGDELTVGYDDFKDHVISSVNGKEISSLKEFVAAIEENQGDYHVLVDEWGNQLVLERKKTEEAQQRILERYKIGSDRSPDLRGDK